MKTESINDAIIGGYFNASLLKHIRYGTNSEILDFLKKENPCQLVDRSNLTLLHIAAKYGNNAWFVRYLIDFGAHVDARSHLGETPLMFAVINEKIEVVKVLLEAGADIFVPDRSGQCALGKAFNLIYNNDIVKALLERVTSESLNNSRHINNKAFHIHCPLYRFISLKNVEVTRILLAKGSPIEAKDFTSVQTALHTAVKELDMENVKLLLAHGADVNTITYGWNTPLCSLVDYRDQDKALAMINVLFAAGAKLVDHDQLNILAEALLIRGDKKVIRRALEHQLDLHFKDRRGHRCLHYLAQNQNPDVFAELRDFDFDVNVPTEDSVLTMLHYAASNGNPSTIRFLLDRGADIHATCRDNCTPLERIFDRYYKVEECLDSYVECIEILLARGADPRVVTVTNDWREWPIFNVPSPITPFKLMLPILLHLSALEVSGQKIEPITIITIQSNPRYKDAFCSKKAELEEMKRIKLGKSATMLDVLVASDKEISSYARNRSFSAALFGAVKKDSWDPCYQRNLHESFLQLTKFVDLREKVATVIYTFFSKFYNISVYNVAEKIVKYLEDHELHKLL